MTEYPSHVYLRTYPDPVLRKPTNPIEVFDDTLREFCAKMIVMMKEHDGVGLAANQIGFTHSVFVTGHNKEDKIWINPRIEDPKGSEVHEEGCLSFPGLYIRVPRFTSFTFVAQNEYGEEQRINIEPGNFFGIVVQHELDHLKGKVFVDYLNKTHLHLLRKRMDELREGFNRTLR